MPFAPTRPGTPAFDRLQRAAPAWRTGSLKWPPSGLDLGLELQFRDVSKPVSFIFFLSIAGVTGTIAQFIKTKIKLK